MSELLRSVSEKIAQWSVVLLAALLPLFFLPFSYVTIPQAKLGFVALVVVVAVFFWLVARLFEGGGWAPRHTVLFSAATLPLAYLASVAMANWPSSALVSGLAEQDVLATVALWFSALAISALVLSDRPRAVVTAIRALILGVLLLSVFQAVRLFFPGFLSLNTIFPNATVTAVGGWHDLGVMFGLAVILVGGLWRTAIVEGMLWRSLAGFTFLFSLAALVVISMSDVWFVLAATSALLALYAFLGARPDDATRGSRMMRSGLWVVIAVVSFLCGWYQAQIHERLPAPIRVTAVEVRPSLEGTLAVGSTSLQEPQQLLFGSGPNTFARNWALKKPTEVNSTLFWNFDFNTGVGVVPTAFVTIGVVGVLAWLALALGFLFSAGRALAATRSFDSSQVVVFTIACAVLYLLAFHVMYAPGVAITGILFLLLGVFVALPLGDAPHRGRRFFFGLNTIGNFASIVVAVGAAGLVFLASAATLQALVSDVYVNKAIADFGAGKGVTNSSDLIQKAVAMSSSNDRAHRAAVELGILKLAELIRTTPNATPESEALRSTLQETIEHGLAAVAIDKADYQNWLSIAQLYQELAGAGVQGAFEQAESAYKTARTESPKNPLPLLRLAQLAIVKGQRIEAIKYLDEAIALKPDYAIAHFLRSQLQVQQGNGDEALKSAAAAVQLLPQDPVGWYNLGSILYLGGSWTEASTAFAQAINLQNDYANATFMLALSLYQGGNVDGAVAALNRVRELNPNEPIIPVMITNIQNKQDPFTGLTQTQAQ